MAEKSFFLGTPEKVAGDLRAYADAGVDWMCVIDYLAVLGTVEESAQTSQRTLDLCRLLKA